MPVSPLAAGFPQAPFVDPSTGDIANVWRFFLMALYKRTGDAVGDSVAKVTAALAVEVTARGAADLALGASVAAEVTARGEAVASEATTRADADAAMETQIVTLINETVPDAVNLTRQWFELT